MKAKDVYRIGIDIGSTTLKVVMLDSRNQLVRRVYKRHQANFNQLLAEELLAINSSTPHAAFTVSITGSAGMGVSERTGIPFIQEVVASINVVQQEYPTIHTLIDLGGEDAKIVFFPEGKQPEIRMNGSCAGGTGAFIDQMADLMNIHIEELAEQALHYKKIYPVASRCGVFARTDVQNLIARNVPTADIAMSIFHTVALQTVTTLSRGSEMHPGILCIGGPLTFIPALRNAFRNVLNVAESDLQLSDYGEYFPAWGAALSNLENQTLQDLQVLIEKLANKNFSHNESLPSLFNSEKEYATWKATRNIKPLRHTELRFGEHIDCFLGIDSGSTTSKILVMDSQENILYSFYDSNEGNPLKKVIEGLQNFYDETSKKGCRINFLSSAVTGYGEDLVKSALNLDYGIVETMAHLSGAQYVDPKVSFVLDIGGQDMKSIFTDKGLIANIELNEACSSGCGSFLQNFASTMNMTLAEFTQAACLAKHPGDLGSRCTVFMNSKVKQLLRENASLGDIAAGLSYSVVKNCLFKVLKISNLNHLGEHIVVQGGTFRNDAVYRAMELLSGKSISSTDSPELMGALGAALYARKMWLNNKQQTGFSGKEALPSPEHIQTKELQCKGCANQCSILRFKFENGNTSYAGNKCEKVFFNKGSAPQKGYNAFDEKNKILFNRTTESLSQPKQTIGIPRVLNMYENYPFWHTLFTACGMQVVLSSESNFSLYQKGVGHIMSDNICFPAKLVHGHILDLVNQHVNRIFYPIVIKEEKELKHSNNSFNCPIVSGYPDVVRSSMEPEEKYGIPFDKPVITFSNNQALKKACYHYLKQLGVSTAVFNTAFDKALHERKETLRRLIGDQRKLFDKLVSEQKLIFVVAGRPYHADPLVNQKVGQILSDMGVNVFTDDIFRHHPDQGFGKLNIVSQWSYCNRVVQAAMEVAKLPSNVQMVQLNSFGCGPDSFFMDETGEILKQAGKNHTLLRIDEIASPGSIRLRMRSLIESLKVSGISNTLPSTSYKSYEVGYKKEDRKKTIIAPWFSDFISPFVPAIGELAGYKIVNLPPTTKETAELGLVYGHNEVCYPSTLVLGDIISALQSGDYDLDNIVVAITQTGGQCRATNYLSQIKSGLENAGYTNLPVLVISTGAVYQNNQKAFKVPVVKLINILVYALLYADAVNQMYSSTVVREIKKGESLGLFNFYIERGVEAVKKNNYQTLLALLNQAVDDFNWIPVQEKTFEKIGLIGEIYVKYNNYGQAHITEWLRRQNMEVLTPPIMDFVMQYFVNSEVNVKNGVNREGIFQQFFKPAAWKYMNSRIDKVEKIMSRYRFYTPSESIYTKAKHASEILDLSNQFGEGWCIAAEVAGYARRAINRVVCVQPFGCIANHVVAKGIEKRLKKYYPEMNLLYLDIDGGMAKVNLQNRLHFLIS